jgi:hypothetical protein
MREHARAQAAPMERQQPESSKTASKAMARATVSVAAGFCGCAFRCGSLKSFSGIREGFLFDSIPARGKRTPSERKTSAETAHCGNLEVWRLFPYV